LLRRISTPRPSEEHEELAQIRIRFGVAVKGLRRHGLLQVVVLPAAHGCGQLHAASGVLACCVLAGAVLDMLAFALLVGACLEVA
jgi:hypothetical protein